VYDPLIHSLVDIRGDNVYGKWGIKVTIFIVKAVDKKLLLNRLYELMKKVIELESVYL